ncbi:hypothetical protein, partial [Paenibacillus kribbensis]|uniref:hypothetical protein n=1 Tax=Paenibacillus kribbensis TaxID=172713 RepID=UPI001C40082D
TAPAVLFAMPGGCCRAAPGVCSRRVRYLAEELTCGQQLMRFLNVQSRKYKRTNSIKGFPRYCWFSVSISLINSSRD